ncbi:potassium/proton antiporter [Methanobrevibacter curvatus]|uniref:K(+)/H(+) antiporter NhaP2 n=1 Tax=Methanobrevibacter curvatus TaxID=49547 RepID=A0A162FFH1_9EURY|nr:potassium/proton antiporter [Methanobrevibacter curvatus]KZX12325.1 K(+)/H(+) antiporter NhaP2 [Methanobrevibacter curvatus]
MILPGIEYILLFLGLLLISSVLLSKFSSYVGIPVLLVFLVMGMFMGSEGPIGIYFDNYELVQYLSILALTIILFSGGLDTEIEKVRVISKRGVVLATLGVLITTITVGLIMHFILGFNLIFSLLIGSIISSTDISAVLSVFKSANIKLKNNIQYLIEFESAVNDPMANILTLTFLNLVIFPKTSLKDIIISLVTALLLGVLIGYLSGRLSIKLIKNIKLESKGLYPVLLISVAFLTFVVSQFVGGNGFLSVYIAALLIGNSNIDNKKAQLNFFDGLSWIMEISMFIILGLVVFPSQLFTHVFSGLIIAVGLILVARPLAVYICLIKSKFNFKEKIFISWTGIRGAVPIVFATYPLIAGIPNALFVFNIVFFITLISIVLQGSTIKLLGRKLDLIEE